MDAVLQFLNDVVVLFRSGFNQVNMLLGIAIALVASFQLSAWRYLWKTALAALGFHIVASVVAPVIDHGARLQLPPLLDLATWRNWLAIYVGYVILITLFYFLRTQLSKSGGGHG